MQFATQLKQREKCEKRVAQLSEKAIREFFEILKHQAYLDGTKLTKKKKSQCQKRLNEHLSEFDRLFETIVKLRESINGGCILEFDI